MKRAQTQTNKQQVKEGMIVVKLRKSCDCDHWSDLKDDKDRKAERDKELADVELQVKRDLSKGRLRTVVMDGALGQDPDRRRALGSDRSERGGIRSLLRLIRLETHRTGNENFVKGFTASELIFTPAVLAVAALVKNLQRGEDPQQGPPRHAPECHQTDRVLHEAARLPPRRL